MTIRAQPDVRPVQIFSGTISGASGNTVALDVRGYSSVDLLFTISAGAVTEIDAEPLSSIVQGGALSPIAMYELGGGPVPRTVDLVDFFYELDTSGVGIRRVSLWGLPCVGVEFAMALTVQAPGLTFTIDVIRRLREAATVMTV